MVDVFLDEKFIGTVDNVNKFLDKFKEERRNKKVPDSLNVYYDEDFNEIYIESTRGRARRPLIIVKDGKSMLNEQYISLLKKGKMAWNELVDAGVIEYLDASEEENTFIALEEEDLTKEHTHLEISPVTILGLCTSLVPYSNYCSPSRLIRGSKIQKQGLGLYAANFLTRLDTDANILHYPQRPIVRSFTHELFNYDSHPFGQNFTIALMS
jgi:DNA-directed RNA polymerase beta subunit